MKKKAKNREGQFNIVEFRQAAKAYFGEGGGGLAQFYTRFLEIMDKELQLEMNPNQTAQSVFLDGAVYFWRLAQRVTRVARNSTVLRCCGKMGGLTRDEIAAESDGAHTNLVRTIVGCALDFAYGWSEDTPNYDRRDVDEAALIHDLPENETDDQPDNHEDAAKKAEKDAFEREYTANYLKLYRLIDVGTATFRIEKLLDEMRSQSSEEGRMLYLADKLAAVVMVLCYDELGLYPCAGPDDDNISEINRVEMNMCDFSYGDHYLLSEMWTIDFLFVRELVKYDDFGFFTALLIAVTLLCHNGKWYHWREEQYLS